jgi:hypothetical protein
VAKIQGFEGIQTTVLPHLGGFFRIVLVGCLALLQVANASGVDREWKKKTAGKKNCWDLANAEDHDFGHFRPRKAAGMNKKSTMPNEWSDMIVLMISIVTMGLNFTDKLTLAESVIHHNSPRRVISTSTFATSNMSQALL